MSQRNDVRVDVNGDVFGGMDGDVDLSGKQAIVDGMNELAHGGRKLTAQAAVTRRGQRDQYRIVACLDEYIPYGGRLPHGEIGCARPDSDGHEVPPAAMLFSFSTRTERLTSWST